MIKENEIEIIGKWIVINNSLKGDSKSERIELLLSNYLIEIATDKSGWNKLYQDPIDKRFWELTFPESFLQGAGAPCLRCLTEDEVNNKYELR